MLLDGGKSVKGIAAVFKEHTKTNCVDILVCTHNDADHANGMLGFLQADLLAKELWLPGRWLDSLPQVLKPLHSIVEQLASALISNQLQIHEQPAGEDPLERLKYVESDANHRGQKFSDIGADGWPEQLLAELECCRAEDWHPSEFFFYPFYPLYWDNFLIKKDPAKREIFLAAIDAAKRIREIAVEAFHRGIRVRWFQHCPTSPCGGTERLRPINAREIKQYSVDSGDKDLLNFLALSVSNQQSLVFYAPGEKDEGSVLFTADSDLYGINLTQQLNQKLKNALVTSPHHGSDANCDAYGKVKAAAGPDAATLSWVRSDGRFSSRPGKAYLTTQQPRYCTLCRNNGQSFAYKKQVELVYCDSSWDNASTTKLCSCTDS